MHRRAAEVAGADGSSRKRSRVGCASRARRRRRRCRLLMPCASPPVAGIPETFVGDAGGDRVHDLVLRRLLALEDADVPAEAEHRDAGRRLEDVVQVVRDQDDREPLLGQPLDEREHLLGLRYAERGGRLVEDHELRVPHHRARDRDGLPLAAGERRDRLADRADRRHARATSASRSSSPPSAAPSAAGTSRAPRARGTCSARRRGCRRAPDPGRRPRSRASPRPSGRWIETGWPSKRISPFVHRVDARRCT